MEINTDTTKKIMANSGLEISNPHFNKMVLRKIMKTQKIRLIVSHIFFYLLIVTIIACIIARTNGIDSFADVILNAIAQLGAWFLTYEFIILPFFILLIIKGLVDIALHRHVKN